MENEQQVRPIRPRVSSKTDKLDNLREIDKKRVFIAVLILGVVLGAGLMWAKDALPQFLAQQEKKTQEQSEKAAEVAGETDIDFELLQRQIDDIKEDVLKLKPEDVTKQKPVQKILEDLEELKKKASESAGVFDVKGNLCEEAKKRFCQ